MTLDVRIAQQNQRKRPNNLRVGTEGGGTKNVLKRGEGSYHKAGFHLKKAKKAGKCWKECARSTDLQKKKRLEKGKGGGEIEVEAYG